MARTTDEGTRCLVHVRYAAAAVEETRASLREAVATARSAGATWTKIAEAMGISPKAAAEQFGARDPAEAR